MPENGELKVFSTGRTGRRPISLQLGINAHVAGRYEYNRRQEHRQLLPQRHRQPSAQARPTTSVELGRARRRFPECDGPRMVTRPKYSKLLSNVPAQAAAPPVRLPQPAAKPARPRSTSWMPLCKSRGKARLRRPRPELRRSSPGIRDHSLPRERQASAIVDQVLEGGTPDSVECSRCA